jgi:hypothetical protein
MVVVTVDPVSLIVVALVAGASAGVQQTASAAITDGYKWLKGAVAARFAGNPAAEVALFEHGTDPDTWAEPLKKALASTGAADDAAIVAAARRLMELVDPNDTRKYTVNLPSAQGVQVGDHNDQRNMFHVPSPGS